MDQDHVSVICKRHHAELTKWIDYARFILQFPDQLEKLQDMIMDSGHFPLVIEAFTVNPNNQVDLFQQIHPEHEMAA